MTVPREHPYIWTTWLPRLLTGENSCEWAIWFKAHYQDWAKQPSDFNQADWLSSHTELLNQQRDQWTQSGYDVRVENQNAFRLRGHSATLAGKPDLLVLNKDHIRIIDVKNGQEQPWHRYQVMTYMYALPRALPEYQNAKIAGEIVYSNHTERVPQGGIDQGFISNLANGNRLRAQRRDHRRLLNPRWPRTWTRQTAVRPRRGANWRQSSSTASTAEKRAQGRQAP